MMIFLERNKGCTQIRIRKQITLGAAGAAAATASSAIFRLSMRSFGNREKVV